MKICNYQVKLALFTTFKKTLPFQSINKKNNKRRELKEVKVKRDEEIKPMEDKVVYQDLKIQHFIEKIQQFEKIKRNPTEMQ